MSFSASKGSEDWVKGTAELECPGQPPATLSSVNTCLGRRRYTLFNKTKGYKPSFGKVNPIIHYDNVASNPSGTAKIYRVFNGKTALMMVVTGQLASLVQSKSSPNYLGEIATDEEDLWAVAQAVSRSREAKVQLLTTAGELPETLDMLKDPYLKLARQGDKFQKLLPRNVRRSVSAITNAWLQIRYGVIPVVQEINTYWQEFERNFSLDLNPLRKTRAGTSNSSLTNSRFTRTFGGGYFRGTEDVTLTTRLHATNYYRVVESVNSNYGLNWQGLVQTAWELIPYSFVIDWFADVGGWLGTVLPNSSVSDLGNCLSTTNESVFKCTVEGASYSSTVSSRYPNTGVNNVYTQTRRSYLRNVNLALPALPQVRWGLNSLKRSLDSVSLLHQQAQRKFSVLRG